VVGRREADSDPLAPGRSRLTSRMTPYDTDARWGVKRDEFWNGYKVHLSQTCTAPGAADTAGPATRAVPGPSRGSPLTGPTSSQAWRPRMRPCRTRRGRQDHQSLAQSLAARDLLPAEHDQHYLDSGYPSAELIVRGRTHGIALITPVLGDTSVQARGNAGFQAAAFHIDWQSRRATCPQASTAPPGAHAPSTAPNGTDKIVVKFAGVTCGACPVRDQSTTAKRGGRQLTLNPRDLNHASVKPAPGRTPSTGGPTTPCGPVSRAPSARPSPSPACVAPATAAWPRPTLSTCTAPSRST
jgi:hypothetical protein